MSEVEVNEEGLQAGEYVLGTLDAKERKRFQVKLMQSTKLREQTNMWEQRLNEMGARIPPIRPNPRVLAKIHERIDGGGASTEKVSHIRTKRSSISLISLASAAVIALAMFIALEPFKHSQESLVPEATAVFEESKQPLVLVSISNDRFQVVPTQNLPQLTQKDYELWAIVEGRDAPISLGVMPQEGLYSFERPKVLDGLILSKLAISIEPLGGSVTGSPSQVAYVTDVFDV